MRWEEGRQSENVEDRRRISPKVAVGGGIGILVVALLLQFAGINPQPLLNAVKDKQQEAAQREQDGGVDGQPVDPAEERMKEFVATILGYTEDVWTKVFRNELRKEYAVPKLVLFREKVESACGYGSAASGPFYCPGDSKVYLDLSFFDELSRKFGAPGDFAQAYVVAHEVGHHVQNLMGISDKVHRMKAQVSEAEYNALSVRLELQADFFAGVWAHHAHKEWKILERGDIEEAMKCAAAIGDDRLQKQAKGYVQPESFTHGTSAQRARWFNLGLQTGDMKRGDTFNADEL